MSIGGREATGDRREVGHTLTSLLSGAGIYLVVILLVIVGAATSPGFLAPDRLLGTFQNVALLGIVATGVAFVTFSGHFADLSVPAIMALSGIVTVSAVRFGLWPAMALGVGAGLVVGAINGWVIGCLRAN